MDFTVEYTKDYKSRRNDRTAILEAKNNGSFWRPCPGTTGGYYCCGYQILTPLVGCGMECSYCVLQSYFDHRCQVLFENREEIAAELACEMPKWPRKVVRFGTGEFADSLYADESLGLSVWLADIIASWPNALLEYKTKSTRIGQLHRIRNRGQIVIGFSMSPQRNIECFERNTASLSQRLEAAAKCEAMGFWVAFHFDPMIYYPQWEEEYRDLVQKIFKHIENPAHIAWWSMGGFRTMPSLKHTLRERGSHLSLFSGELVMGTDHKLRYFRPIRTAFYRTVREEIERVYPETTLYMCMESPELWRDSGMMRRIPHGLVRYLDDRAVQMLHLDAC